MEEVNNSNSNNSQNKNNVDYIDNEVSLVNLKSKSRNDEIIKNNHSNNNNSNNASEQKGKNKKKKKKNLQNDKTDSKELSYCKPEGDINKNEENMNMTVTQAAATTKICVENCTDNNHNNELANSDKANKEEEEAIANNNSKPFAAPLADFAMTSIINVVDNAVVNADEPYCPLTPRRIVDVEEQHEQDTCYDIMKSNSRIMSKNDNENMTDNNEYETQDDDFLDDEFDDPDGGLLVQFLDEANRIAEAKLAQRRQARVEAREIRMRELERQQKEQEQNADRVFDMQSNSIGAGDALTRTRVTAGMSSLTMNSVLNATRANSMCSRRSSEDSLEEEGRSLRDIRHELKDVEERFRKAMIANAQLDNERASQTYQIQLLKDKLEEMEESYAQLQREFKDKSRECNAFKRQLDKLTEELKLVQGQLNERDTLISEQGLVIVAVENEDGSDARRALVTVENAQLLGTVQGSLDVRLKKFSEEKQQLMAEVLRLQEQLDNYKNHGKQRGSMTNGPMSDDEYEAQREANKIITEYKYKLQKAEQEIASLQSSLARSETQVIRYKSTAEAAEKAEAELKIERRKLQRENREAMERLEELETANNHLLKRMDKLKNVKSALLKDL